MVPEEWSLDSGELTPTLKLRRRVIVEKYAVEIAGFYTDEEGSASPAAVSEAGH